MKIEFEALSSEESYKVTAALLPLLQTNRIVVFDGPMGSGKTSLIKNLCNALGVTDLVNSPTYGLINEYKTKTNQPIYHFDFYRINTIEEAFDMGAEEYFYSEHLCLIEWADKVLSLLPAHYLKVSIAYHDNKRDYCIEQL